MDAETIAPVSVVAVHRGCPFFQSGGPEGSMSRQFYFSAVEGEIGVVQPFSVDIFKNPRRGKQSVCGVAMQDTP